MMQLELCEMLRKETVKNSIAKSYMQKDWKVKTKNI